MKKKQTKSGADKSVAFVVFEYVLLAFCLSIIALRVTFAESPSIRSTGSWNLYEGVYSLCISAALTFCFVVWLVLSACAGRLSYRRSGVEIGLCVFLAGAVIAGLVAPDKRLAISSLALLIGPILMALLLVQILDTGAKIRLVLVVIAALGVVNAQQSAEQALASNKITIDEYEKSPEAQLELRGIEPDTFNAFLFEHRLYSEGISGFFITRNSSGSFGLLAFFAALALLIDQFRNRQADSSQLPILACGVATGVIIISLVITRSKGALIGLFFAGMIFAVYFRFGNWLKAHRRSLFAGCLLAAVVAAAGIACYGMSHGRLPGGNSMLVRWQYWRAAAQMYADHPVTGVGPGAFADYYTYYKPAAALEVVTDPHNFPLSILTQYGLLGLVGFLCMLLLPLWKVLSPQSSEPSSQDRDAKGGFGKLVVVFALIISAVMLICRPMMLPLPFDATPEEKQAGVIILYLMPVFVFLVGLLLLAIGQRSMKKESQSVIVGALFAAVIGLLIHNMIDFAIFEPGVFTTFWAIVACMVAAQCNLSCRPHIIRGRIGPVIRFLLSFAAGIVVIAVYLNYVLYPVIRSTAKISRANIATGFGRYDLVHDILYSAANDDALSPSALTLDARLHLNSYEMDQKRNPDLLLMAEDSLKRAIRRNSAAYKNFERLGNIYILLAETDKPSEGESWLDKAFEATGQAIDRYPGCARLRVESARVAEQLGKCEIAIEQYREAVDIEDSYRRQFQTIYPNREDIVSRLGEDKYLFAKERLELLDKEKSP